jgi:hypothetical protein
VVEQREKEEVRTIDCSTTTATRSISPHPQTVFPVALRTSVLPPFISAMWLRRAVLPDFAESSKERKKGKKRERARDAGSEREKEKEKWKKGRPNFSSLFDCPLKKNSPMSSSGLLSLPWVRDALALPGVETILDAGSAEVRIRSWEGVVWFADEFFCFPRRERGSLTPFLDLLDLFFFARNRKTTTTTTK